MSSNKKSIKLKKNQIVTRHYQGAWSSWLYMMNVIDFMLDSGTITFDAAETMGDQMMIFKLFAEDCEDKTRSLIDE